MLFRSWRSFKRLLPVLIVLHIVAVLLQASPAPMSMDRASWKQPAVQAELSQWAERLDMPTAELEERLWTLTDRYMRVRQPGQELFSPYYRYCGTAQGWRMFVAPDLEPTLIEIEIFGHGQWQMVYRELDSGHRWQAGILEHWRLRVALFSTIWTKNWVEFRWFSEWVAANAKQDFPEAERVKIRLYQSHLLPADQVRAGAKAEGKYLWDEVIRIR